MRKPKISLVVLNYNGIKLLKNYFDSIFKQTLLPDEIMMLDNASVDESVKFVKKNYPGVKIVKNSFNEGTAEGTNIGFGRSRGEFIIFQSNDLALDKNCIKNLFAAIVDDDKIGIATSVLLRESDYLKNKKKIIDNAGGIMDKYGFGMQKYPFVNYKKIPERGEVFFAYGGSFIIKRDVFKMAGGFDRRFFTLNDDIDLSWRVRLLGLKIIYTKQSFVFHKGSATLGRGFSRFQKRYLSQRNNIRSVLKNYFWQDYLMQLPIYFLLLFAENIYYLYRRRFDFITATLAGLVWNLIYLPETITMRFKIRRKISREKISTFLYPKSLKIKFFNEFRKAI